MKTCFIMNIGPHYRFPIYSEIGNIYDVAFYFGNHLKEKIRSLEYDKLPSFGGVLKNTFFGPFFWQHGAVGKLFDRRYDQYVMVGDVYCLSTWAILFLSKLRENNKTCLWTHGLYGSENRFQHLVKKAFYRLADRILVYSEFSINNMVDAGISKEKMLCIANSLDSKKEEAIRNRMKPTPIYSNHFDNDNPTIIYCGRIQKRKRLDLIVESLCVLRERGKKVNLIVVGKDDDNVNLEQLAKERELEEQIWFYGPCYDDEKLAELFYNASVCVSPGNVGLTAIHSLTFGCPVVTHNNFTQQMPEFEAIEDGVTGSFFDLTDINSLANAIEPWLDVDAEKREKTRMAAFKEVDWKWNVDYQIGVLGEILDKKS